MAEFCPVCLPQSAIVPTIPLRQFLSGGGVLLSGRVRFVGQLQGKRGALAGTAHYYNRAAEWGQEVSISTKKAAYAPGGNNLETIGSIIDFEKIGSRSPGGIRPGAWQVDHPIGSTWGYTSDMRTSGPAAIIVALADTVSKNGVLLLNLSPRADGTIPPEQQDTLLAVGAWLDVNGEAVYGTHAWTTFGVGGGRGDPGPHVRFTVKGDALYAIVLGPWPAGREVLLTSLASVEPRAGRFIEVHLLGADDVPLGFTQDATGMKVQLPDPAPAAVAFTLKITGLETNSTLNTRDGNPPAP